MTFEPTHWYAKRNGQPFATGERWRGYAADAPGRVMAAYDTADGVSVRIRDTAFDIPFAKEKVRLGFWVHTNDPRPPDIVVVMVEGEEEEVRS